jgi:hypothetical protein
MSIIQEGFRSLHRSGAYFAEAVLPHALEKAGLRRGAASKIGLALGGLAGIASFAVGACFFAALPMSAPMFTVAVAIYGAKGIGMVGVVAGILAGTGVVVTTTAAGMCRALKNEALHDLNKLREHYRHDRQAPPAPEKTSFRHSLKAALSFRKAAEGARPAPPPAEKPPVQVPQPG